MPESPKEADHKRRAPKAQRLQFVDEETAPSKFFAEGCTRVNGRPSDQHLREGNQKKHAWFSEKGRLKMALNLRDFRWRQDIRQRSQQTVEAGGERNTRKHEAEAQGEKNQQHWTQPR